MKLNCILEDPEIVEVRNNNPEIDIEHIAYNSQKVVPNSMFVAIRGLKTDGHKYIGDAISRGAILVIYEHDLDEYQDDIMYVKVKNARHMLGTMSSRFYGHPSEALSITGVTGTNGKTTITYMLKSIFQKDGRKCGLIGTINNQIGDEIIDNAGRTTPDSLEVQEIISEMVEAGCQNLVMEVSSHALDLDRVNGVAFDYGIFSNLTQDHLDYHKTFENYFEAKAKLFTYTSKANIINCDDVWGKKLYDRCAQKKGVAVYSYGLNPECDFYARDMKYSIEGTRYTLVTKDGEEEIFVSIPGEVMVYNSMAAIINALLEGISIEVIKEALASMSGVEGRMERLDLDTEFDIIIDYAHSPDSLERLLKSVKTMYDGKVYLVFGCNGDRDKEKRPIMGRIAGEFADHVIVTSDNPASEDPQSIIDTVAAAVAEKTDACETVLRRWDAIYYAATLPKAGDVLVLAGKGHEKQETMKDENLYYNEWETAEEAVRRLKAGK